MTLSDTGCAEGHPVSLRNNGEVIKVDNKVKVYSTPTCPYCIRVKQFLKENSIEFEDVDVSTNQQAAQEMIDKSGQMAVPVLDVNGEIITGFDKDKISQLLGL